MSEKLETIKSKIWNEIAEPDNPFAAKVCYCNGYDVFGDLLGKISWSEYVFLLFFGEPATKKQSALLEGLSIVLANPGIRDYSVRAAMNGGVGGSTSASCLMAALAVGSGNLNGSREVYLMIEAWKKCKQDIDKWANFIFAAEQQKGVSVWKPIEHVPGFDPYGVSCSTPVKQALGYLRDLSPSTNLLWLHDNRQGLEELTGISLAMSGVVATAFVDLDLPPDKAEMLHLILRLPGAAVHALEQKKNGWQRYPFFYDGINLTGTSKVDKCN